MSDVDPQQFGEVKAKGESSEKRLDNLDNRFDKVEKMLTRLTYLVIANMIGGIGTVAYGGEAKEILLSFINLFV